MGNCGVLCKRRKSTDDEHHQSVLRKDLLARSPGESVTGSGETSRGLPLNHELKMRKVYSLVPPSVPHRTAAPMDGEANREEEEDTTGLKRIKVVITKQQLRELRFKQISMEEILVELENRTSLSAVSSSENWKPELQSVPEGTELQIPEDIGNPRTT